MKMKLSKKASVKIGRHIKQGIKYGSNKNIDLERSSECGGYLIGTISNSEQGIVISIDDVYYDELKKGNYYQFAFDKQYDYWAQRYVDYEYKNTDKVILGRYHSHVKLGVDASKEDMQYFLSKKGKNVSMIFCFEDKEYTAIYKDEEQQLHNIEPEGEFVYMGDTFAFACAGPRFDEFQKRVAESCNPAGV